MRKLLRLLLLALLSWGVVTTAIAEGRWQTYANKPDCKVWNGNPQPNEIVKWSGRCINGVAEGYGKRVWRYTQFGVQKQQSYTGHVRKGKWHGRGIIELASGNRYEGEVRDGNRHGSGVYVWADGRRYEGNFKNGRRHGQGVFVLPTGRRYEGGWGNGKPHGNGTYTRKDEKTLTGFWNKGCLNTIKIVFAVGARMAACKSK